MVRAVPIFCFVALLGGCASTEINYNALDVASTYDTLITKQVVFNILKTYKDQFGVPAYVKIGTQVAQTTDSINPTFSFPFSPQTTLTQMLTATGLTATKSLQTAGSGISLQIQANRNQNYTLSPTIDPDQLRRIRSIYQYITGYMSEYDFESDYPIIEAAASSGSVGNAPTLVSGSFAGSPFEVKIGGPLPMQYPQPAPTVYVRRACAKSVGLRCIEYIYPIIRPDLTFIKPPGCVMCDYGTRLRSIKPGTPDNVILLQKNYRLVGRCFPDRDRPRCTDTLRDLFFYLPNEEPREDAYAVHDGGFATLYLKGLAGMQAFNELALFTQEAASQGTGSPASGGQSYGRKSEPLLTISGPGTSTTIP
jgi:hypothetical protein